MASKANGAGSPRLFLVGGYAVLIMGFLLAGVTPSVRAISAVRTDIRRYQSEIDARQSTDRQLEKIKTDIASIQELTHDYELLVPANEDLGSFLKEVSQQLDDSKMRDISVQNLASTPLGRTQRLPIVIKGRGTYAQFHDFLMRLEVLQRRSSVENLLVKADTDMNGNVEVQLTLFIYSAKTSS